MVFNPVTPSPLQPLILMLTERGAMLTNVSLFLHVRRFRQQRGPGAL
jgi:hypothetical protein